MMRLKPKAVPARKAELAVKVRQRKKSSNRLICPTSRTTRNGELIQSKKRTMRPWIRLRQKSRVSKVTEAMEKAMLMPHQSSSALPKERDANGRKSRYSKCR